MHTLLHDQFIRYDQQATKSDLPNTNIHYMAHLNPDNVPVGTTHIMNQTLICMFLSLKAN